MEKVSICNIFEGQREVVYSYKGKKTPWENISTDI